MLADPLQADDLRTLGEWLRGSRILSAEAELARIEAEKDRIVREEKKARDRLTTLLDGRGG
jgi:hypothetical protein